MRRHELCVCVAVAGFRASLDRGCFGVRRRHGNDHPHAARPQRRRNESWFRAPSRDHGAGNRQWRAAGLG